GGRPQGVPRDGPGGAREEGRRRRLPGGREVALRPRGARRRGLAGLAAIIAAPPMGLFSSVSSKQIDEFAQGLARELARQLPPKKELKGSQTKKLVIALEGIFASALEFRREHKLGVYKKARLGNAFQWELQEQGYDKRFAEDAAQRLLIY